MCELAAWSLPNRPKGCKKPPLPVLSKAEELLELLLARIPIRTRHPMKSWLAIWPGPVPAVSTFSIASSIKFGRRRDCAPSVEPLRTSQTADSGSQTGLHLIRCGLPSVAGGLQAVRARPFLLECRRTHALSTLSPGALKSLPQTISLTLTSKIVFLHHSFKQPNLDKHLIRNSRRSAASNDSSERSVRRRIVHGWLCCEMGSLHNKRPVSISISSIYSAVSWVSTQSASSSSVRNFGSLGILIFYSPIQLSLSMPAFLNRRHISGPDSHRSDNSLRRKDLDYHRKRPHPLCP